MQMKIGILIFVFIAYLHVSNSEENIISTALSADAVLAKKWYAKRVLCSNLKSLLMKVDTSMSRLETEALRNDTSLTSRKFIGLTRRELNATRSMVFRSIGVLYRLIHNNVTDIDELRANSNARLKELRSETLREEKAFASIIDLDATIDKATAANESNHAQGIVDGIIKAVASSADKLQKDLTDHVFENALKNPKLNKAANVEAVIRLDDDGKVTAAKAPAKEKKSVSSSDKGSGIAGKGKGSKAGMAAAVKDKDVKEAVADSEQTGGKMVKLVDAHDNLFVLSKGRDSTVPLEDKTLILDVVYLIILAAVLGLICQVIGFPAMFGHILAGILLGPSCFNVLKSVVQLETIGQFGVFLILFSVGLEFAPERVRPVVKQAFIASAVPAVLLVCVCALSARWFLNAAYVEGAFVGACLSLSSTPLVINFLSKERTAEAETALPPASGTADYSLLLLGILVMQDVYLALLMAILPWLAVALSSDSAGASGQALNYALDVFKLFLALLLLVVITVLLFRYISVPLIRMTNRYGRGATLLVVMGVAFGYLYATHLSNLSMELGCFMAGVAFSTLSRSKSGDLEPLVEPVRDFLSAIFFASIGLHVFPKFLVYEVTLLSACTAVTVVVKFATCFLILCLCVPKNDRARRFVGLVSAGLAQVSEFSFVLGSIARRLGLCSREVYLLILGVTTLSLLVAPVLWKLFLYQANLTDSSCLCRWFRKNCCQGSRCCPKDNTSKDDSETDNSSEALLGAHRKQEP